MNITTIIIDSVVGMSCWNNVSADTKFIPTFHNSDIRWESNYLYSEPVTRGKNLKRRAKRRRKVWQRKPTEHDCIHCMKLEKSHLPTFEDTRKKPRYRRFHNNSNCSSLFKHLVYKARLNDGKVMLKFYCDHDLMLFTLLAPTNWRWEVV